MNRYYIYLLPTTFIAVILLIVTGQFKSNKSIDQLRRSNLGLLEELNTRNQLQQLKTRILRLETRGRGIVISGNPYDSLMVGLDIQLITETLDSLARLDSDVQLKTDLVKLRELSDRKILFTKEILEGFSLYGKTHAENLIITDRGTMLTDSIRMIADKIAIIHERSVTDLIQQAERDATRAKGFSMLLAIIAAVAALLTFLFFTYRLAQQQRIIEQLNASEQKLREAALLKERFLANMSHEIRTPMNAMLGFTDLLEHQQMDVVARSYVESIRTSGESLLGLLNDVLDLSKMEAGMIHLQQVPFQIRKIALDITAMFRAKANARQIQFDMIVKPEIPEFLEGDPQRLQQILVNLIGNALKFTHQGQVVTTIHCESKNDQESVLRIEVRDSGIGMDKETQGQIFERFVQANTHVSQVYGGTGLGLSIVKDLVLLHNGKIEVQSEPGSGTLFTLFLPFKNSNLLPDEEQEAAVPLSLDSENNLKGSYWLLVEDNELNQMLMSHILQSRGIRFDLAINGREAVERVGQHAYDLILMDLQMPEMDGYATTRYIRETMKKDVPILAISAHAINQEREQCLSAGMNEYLSKPIRAELLMGKAMLLLQKRQKNNKIGFIDLRYLREVSGGDQRYETLVTKQFLDMLPADLIRMAETFERGDPYYRKIAHDLKTTISVMGLNPLMDPWLEELEHGSGDTERFHSLYQRIHEFSKGALEEAAAFLQTLEKKQ